jgi:hypothetical protein
MLLKPEHVNVIRQRGPAAEEDARKNREKREEGGVDVVVDAAAEGSVASQ